MKTKFIFVTGGVVSSIGKGIVSASIGALLEARGLKVSIMKLDPYINVDAGTMNPFQHGEVFVTEDGAETDLDLGHYERFTSMTATRWHNLTAGRVYYNVIEKERKGEYKGKTVQVIPHITDEIKNHILSLARNEKADILITEVGGTVGDIEGLAFLEAIRQMKKDLKPENVLYIHITLVPYLEKVEEYKTKPTQHSVMKLREIGIHPDIIVCRSKELLRKDIKEKIALFCDVSPECVISAVDAESVYEVPLILHREGLDERIKEKLNIWTRDPDLSKWEELVHQIKTANTCVTIGLVGKYVDVIDSYKSLHEALVHGGIANNCRVKVKYIDSEEIEKNGTEPLREVDGIIIPGGFGERGIEGKILTARFARENGVPFLGICLGMQVAVIEFARNVCNMKNANSTEFNPNTPYPVIALLPEQRGVDRIGGTMRLGAYPCIIKNENTKAFKAYKKKEIMERHRHRYEVNPDFKKSLERKGLVLSGLSPDKRLVEIVELKDHPWFLGCQFHPEFKSRPFLPHPLFRDFIKSSIEHKRRNDKKRK
jgi:CTP synthase